MRELLVISQDTSAYGVDLRYPKREVARRTYDTRFIDLARALGTLGVWVRLHYVYPYPHVDDRDSADGGRHAAVPRHPVPARQPAVLKRMRRPAHAEDTLARIERWRRVCPI